MQQLYCSLDFETTGLNTTKDDPIQVGLVIFDATGIIHASFSSLIKPSKSVQELKEIVQYVTGFEISHLQFAPSPKEVFLQVAEYILNKNLILIGHNVSFDLAILQRFIPQWQPQAIVDSFDCARQLLHFQQSYALDAIIHLDQQQTLGIFTTMQGKAHDALYDATASMQLFLRWYHQAKKLINKHPVLK
jgi:DNA polymerase III subunit epsilon